METSGPGYVDTSMELSLDGHFAVFENETHDGERVSIGRERWVALGRPGVLHVAFGVAS